MILLAGFQPFGGEVINPSLEAVRRLAGSFIAGHDVTAIDLPVTFARGYAVLAEAAERHRPALVLLVGQAGGRSEICLERVALNLADTDRPDNDGACPADCPVVADAPAAHLSALPLKPMLAALRAAGIPARISDTAGTYVCNHVFFSACEHLAVPVGLIHVPFAPAQTVVRPGVPSMAIETVVEAVRLAAGTAIAGVSAGMV